MAVFEEVNNYKNLDFFARQVVEGYITGLHRSPFHGFSVEFAEHRLYSPGQSTKHIDWKLYARTDRLYTKRYEEETNLRCHLLVDNSSSMYYPVEQHANFHQPNKLTFAIYASAVIVELLHRQRDAYGLTLFSNNIDLQTPVRSSALHRHHVMSLLQQQLQPIEPKSIQGHTTEITECIHQIAERIHRRSMVIVLTDALIDNEKCEPFFDALRHLRHNKHDVILFHTLDVPHEVELAFGSKPVQFIDLETKQQLKLHPSQAAKAYRESMNQLTQAVGMHAVQYNIDYQPVDITKGFEQIMLPFLLRRSSHK